MRKILTAEKCPKCSSTNIWEDECGNVDCDFCGSLFAECLDCGWDEHECQEEE